MTDDLQAQWANRKPLRVLVCGGRDYDDRALVWNTLSAIGPTVVIHGGASGADAIAGDWAYIQNVPCEIYPANWKEHGRAAGPIRNQRMLEFPAPPHLVIAFPGGRGTADMMRRARAAGVEVREYGA